MPLLNAGGADIAGFGARGGAFGRLEKVPQTAALWVLALFIQSHHAGGMAAGASMWQHCPPITRMLMQLVQQAGVHRHFGIADATQSSWLGLFHAYQPALLPC